MATKIQLRRDTAAAWAAANPILSQGEAGYDITNKLLKIGDGTTAWNLLPGITGDGTGTQGVQGTQSGAAIPVSDLKTLVAASTDFNDFKSRIAAL